MKVTENMFDRSHRIWWRPHEQPRSDNGDQNRTKMKTEQSLFILTSCPMITKGINTQIIGTNSLPFVLMVYFWSQTVSQSVEA